jgi:hypothetical protein
MAEAEAFALFLSDADGTGDFFAVSDAIVGQHTFERTRPCPDGGTHSVSGARNRSLDPATGVVSTSWTSVQSHDACAMTRFRGGRTVTVVIDGSVTAEGSATYLPPEGPGNARQLLSYHNVRTGSTTTTWGDRSRACEIDVTELYDSATDTFLISGTICGRDVAVVRERRDKPTHD